MHSIWWESFCHIKWGSLVYPKLRPMVSALAMIFVVSVGGCFCGVGCLGCPNLCIGLIGLVLLQALRGIRGWSFVEHENLPWYFLGSGICSAALRLEDPRFPPSRLRFSTAPKNIINRPYSITPLRHCKQQRVEDVSIYHP